MKKRSKIDILLFIIVLIALLFQAGTTKSEKMEPTSKDKSNKGETAFLDPVPFTPEPEKQVWKIGFKGGEDIYFLELLPEKEACMELLTKEISDNIVYRPPERIILYPFSEVTKLKIYKITNPKRWTVIDMRNNVRDVSFTQLCTISMDVAGSGCWYIGSESLKKKDKELASINYDKVTDDDSILFAVAGKSKRIPIVRLPIINNYDPTYDTKILPFGFKDRDLLKLSEIKNVLGKKYDTYIKSSCKTYVNSIEATLNKKNKKLDSLWLIHWCFRDLETGEDATLWGIFQIIKKKCKPMFVSKLGVLDEYRSYYSARFISAIDLDGDGIDELIIGAIYYEGKNCKVFALRDGKYVEVYDSFYYGL